MQSYQGVCLHGLFDYLSYRKSRTGHASRTDETAVMEASGRTGIMRLVLGCIWRLAPLRLAGRVLFLVISISSLSSTAMGFGVPCAVAGEGRAFFLVSSPYAVSRPADPVATRFYIDNYAIQITNEGMEADCRFDCFTDDTPGSKVLFFARNSDGNAPGQTPLHARDMVDPHRRRSFPCGRRGFRDLDWNSEYAVSSVSRRSTEDCWKGLPRRLPPRPEHRDRVQS